MTARTLNLEVPVEIRLCLCRNKKLSGKMFFSFIIKAQCPMNWTTFIKGQGPILVLKLCMNNTPPWVFFMFLNCTNDTKS